MSPWVLVVTWAWALTRRTTLAEPSPDGFLAVPLAVSVQSVPLSDPL
jgi:hypothetical protein